jgi:hypothetical protein
MRTRPILVAAVAWAVGAATAIGVGVLALSLVGTGFLTETSDPLANAVNQPVDPGSVTTDPTLSLTPSPTPVASATTTPAADTTSVAGVDRQFNSAGGAALARCVDGLAYLVLWSPAQGFHTGGVVRGPAPKAQVEFESNGREIKLIVTCAGGVPQATTREEVDDH